VIWAGIFKFSGGKKTGRKLNCRKRTFCRIPIADRQNIENDSEKSYKTSSK
jgi:hypothetical protein